MSISLVSPANGIEADPPKSIAACAGAVVLLGGMIVLVRPLDPSKDEWLLPKGHVEPNESAAEAAIREVLEETGAVATIQTPGQTPVIETSLETPRETQQIKWFVARAAYLRGDKQTDKRLIGIFPPLAALAKLTFAEHRTVLATVLSGSVLEPEDS